jgi:hypothetical protein
MLIALSKSKKEVDQTLLRSTCGIAFLGVPHDGMNISSLTLVVKDGPNRFLLESISNIGSQVLSSQQREFSNLLDGEDRLNIICFYETKKSPTAKVRSHILEQG